MFFYKFFILSSLFFTPYFVCGMDTSGEEASETKNLRRCVGENFPNYFMLLPEDEAIDLINKAIGSVLKQIKVSYVENGKQSNDNFFGKIEEIITKEAPGAKVYISGGMVRSILGYIYKKLYNEETRVGQMTAKNVREVFDRIINAKSRKDDPLPFSPDKELTPIDALGIGSDYDLLIDFSNVVGGDISGAKSLAVEFINSL